MEDKKYASFNGISNIESSDVIRRKSENDIDKLEEVNIHDLREKVFIHENELKNKLKNIEEQKQQLQELKKLVENEEDKSKTMIETIISRNGTKFTSDELKLLSKIKNAKDIEYKLSGLETLVDMKNQEFEDIKDYIEQYDDLCNNIEEAIKEGKSESKEQLNKKFDMLQLTEYRSQEILKIKREFEAAINNSGFAINNPIIGTYKSSDKIRSNNFEQLQKKINTTNNKYLNLLSYTANFGRKKENEFDKYIKEEGRSIVECTQEFIKQSQDKTENIERLESKLNEIKELIGFGKVSENKKESLNYIKLGKEVLKDLIGSRDNQEKKLKDMKEIQGLKELIDILNEVAGNEYKENNPILKEIDKKQERLDEVQSFLNFSITNINSMIKDNIENIHLKAYYETILQFGLDKSISEKDKINKTIQRIEGIKKTEANNKRVEEVRKKNWSLAKKVKVKLQPVGSFFKQLLTGKGNVKFRTLGLGGHIYKIKRMMKKEERRLIQIYDKRQSIKRNDIENISNKKGKGMEL